MCAEGSDVFSRLSQYPPNVNDNEVDIMEKFVVMMYDRSSTATCVNNAGLDNFALKPFHQLDPLYVSMSIVLPTGRQRIEPINTTPARNTEPY